MRRTREKILIFSRQGFLDKEGIDKEIECDILATCIRTSCDVIGLEEYTTRPDIDDLVLSTYKV